jgi:hypothetical protein
MSLIDAKRARQRQVEFFPGLAERPEIQNWERLCHRRDAARGRPEARVTTFVVRGISERRLAVSY